ncbi:hypothetical protein [Bergeyella sp. RCAD1439]|uniref:hypothetical protein n=1 Tax=Bergeyella anatis TaxID=3113737 RepID=UPI002E193709|nr:hypothetical protein [Bergeyella sp. RCAD1439]
MRKFLLSILTLGVFVYGNAQKIKSETLELTKVVQPKLLKTENPIDITLVRTTSAEELKNNNLLNTYVSVPRYILNNTSTPKYIAVLDYSYQPATAKIGKLGTTLNELYFKSNIKAVLYLMERDKGVFYQEDIELSNSSQNNWKSEEVGLSSLGVVTLLNETVSNADVGKYILNGEFRPEVVNEIEKKQIERLTIKAYQTIRDCMTENNVKNRLVFNYLKSGDDFTSPDFDNAYSKLKNSINPINKTEILGAIELWKNEAAKIPEGSEKIKKKYKAAILENILTAFYIIDEFNADDVANELKRLDEKSEALYFYTKQKKIFSENNKQIKEFSYAALPDNVPIPEVNKNLFNAANSGSTDTTYPKINKLRPYNTWNYHPILNLNNLKYQLMVLKDEDKLFLKYQNFLMDEILWYMMNIKNNSKELPSKSRKELEAFIAFAEKLNQEYETKKLYKFSDERNYKLMKAREYVSANYKLNDFFQFIPHMDLAVNVFFENKNPKLTSVFKDVVEINSIVQLRKFAYDDYYESQRKEKERELDEYIETKAENIPTYKDEIYFEFKNSIKVLDYISEKRVLSDEEYNNYQSLLNEVLYRLNTYK